ncbi:class I SAM-dependent methyltransferase [Vallicoccus soli]|uniref:Class I SAM-dependent methyltransferase n=1 Tax=Vallicoccus soli TaxID=2339232 RepID=A0A3A3ZL62_9ACTN|nr:class I SAM-dependent methyltransferase [Vallicoccus soli]RJK96886.1 class I SAM-dependent methyltransferase [Vallicoccus soli]
MEATEVRKLAALEDRHWWYAERRALLRRRVAAAGARGPSLDIGAAGGGNTRVLRELGLAPVALEHGAEGAEVARDRGLDVVRGDAQALPVASGALGLVVAFDVLEHLEDDAAAVREVARVLRPGGTFLVAVPADMRLWSAHDEAVGHVRRYDRAGLVAAVVAGGLVVQDVTSWNVLLRPAVRFRRRASTGSDLDDVPAPLNAALRSVVVAERVLPVGRLPGVSLLLTARRPA